MIRRLQLLICLLLLSATLMAQAPVSFKYQAVLRNSAGVPLSEQQLAVRIALLRDAPDGTQVFQETHNVTTNAFGLVNLEIGSISSLSTINWHSHIWFLEVSVDGEVMGVSQLSSVPYALHAATSADSFSGNYDDLSNIPDLSGFIIQESDPFFQESPASGISIEDIEKWDQTFLWGDHSQAGYMLPEAPSAGDMAYFNGDEWVKITAGQTGQTLSFCYNKPWWGPCPALPGITTTAVTNISLNSATTGGEVLNTGDGILMARGVCWSITPLPVTGPNCTNDGNTTGAFTSQLINLTPGETYFVRAYATNEHSTSYGEQLSFTTLDSEVTIPSIEFNGTLFIHPDDNSASISYGPTSIVTNATSHTDGETNTTQIVQALGDHNNGNYAARKCDDLESLGFSDWYLPSKDELNAIYINKDQIGGFSTAAYWSSTEANAVNGYNQYFNTGYAGTSVKTNNFRLRCVRRN